MKATEYKIRSHYDEVDLDVLVCTPDTEDPKAVIQLVHGMCEYKERYVPFMEFLCGKGFACIIHDHRGHGKSVKAPEDLGYFYSSGWEGIVADIFVVNGMAKGMFPGKPVFMFGHSMGSFFARRYLCMYPNEIDGAIICGTGWKPAPVLKGGLLVVKLLSLLRGDKFRSVFVTKLAFGNINKSFEPVKTSKDWLSRDISVAEKYLADAKCGFLFTLNGYRTLFRSMLLAQDSELMQKMDEDLPVLFISGEMDPVGDFGKGVKKAVNAFYASGMENVECVLYPEARHELVNELNREEVFQDVLEWLEFHI